MKIAICMNRLNSEKMSEVSGKVNLQVRLGALTLRNPVIGASGCCGFGRELADFVDFSEIGGLITKSITLHPRQGNPPPRTAETPAGMLNSIGLANPGIDEFVRQELPFLSKLETVVIASIAGDTIEEYAQLAQRLEKHDCIQAIEVNVSCPNVARGGLAFGRDPEATGRVVAEVRQAFTRFLITKLTPNLEEMKGMAVAALEAGSDALSLVNTYVGLAVDWRKRTPRLGGVTGGLSGPAIRPLALYRLYEVAQVVDCPLIGMGGITSAEDVLEFMVTGASAVQMGTANFIAPGALSRIAKDLSRLLADAGVKRVDSLVGSLRLPELSDLSPQ